MTIYALGDKRPVIAPDAWIAGNAAVIGSVILGEAASVWFGAVIRGDNDLITVGRRCNIQDNAVLHTDAGIRLTLGTDVTVGHKAMLHGCSVGEGSLIGINSVILNHAVIGKHSLIGAGSLIPEGKTIPDGVLALGSPAKVVRDLSQAEIENLQNIANGYMRRAKLFKQQLRPQPL
jgi:carbonic anhydrase/acetyltransferase-like protein (isoleucine patch superfamily)